MSFMLCWQISKRTHPCRSAPDVKCCDCIYSSNLAEMDEVVGTIVRWHWSACSNFHPCAPAPAPAPLPLPQAFTQSQLRRGTA
jgi:hypothetical protein